MVDAPLFEDGPSLRRFILDVAEGEVDPRLVAEKVLGQVITLDELRVIADACFTPYVWEQLKRPHPPHPVMQPERAPASKSVTPVFFGGNGIPRASRRQVDFIDAYANELNKRVKVGDGLDARKHFAECTIADLTWMVNYRRTVADRNNAVADQFESFIQAMTDAKAETVADLERRVTEAILFG